jgi:hypothetical protein
MKELNKFYEISIELTGFDKLPPNLIEAYFDKLIKTDGYSENLSKLIDELLIHDTLLEELIKANKVYQELAKGLVFLWYTSELINWQTLGETKSDKLSKTEGTQEEYYEGLIWKAIRAHPPGLSGGYFGHWKYEPEN